MDPMCKIGTVQVLERCFGHFKAHLESSPRNVSSLYRSESDKIQFSLPKRSIGVTHVSMMAFENRRFRSP